MRVWFRLHDAEKQDVRACWSNSDTIKRMQKAKSEWNAVKYPIATMMAMRQHIGVEQTRMAY